MEASLDQAPKDRREEEKKHPTGLPYRFYMVVYQVLCTNRNKPFLSGITGVFLKTGITGVQEYARNLTKFQGKNTPVIPVFK